MLSVLHCWALSQHRENHEWQCFAFSMFYESYSNRGNEDVYEIIQFISKAVDE